MNNTSLVLGSALHIACADNVPNRFDVLRLLLENGADPNIIVKSEEGLLLQSVIAEYITSNVNNLSPGIIKLLLRHGAKVSVRVWIDNSSSSSIEIVLMNWLLCWQIVLKTQFRDPLGLISILPSVTRNEPVFQLILEAAQSFDWVTLKHKRNIEPNCKTLLMNLATNPLSLKHQSRIFLRSHLKGRLHLKVPQLDIPVTLQSYLLFEISWKRVAFSSWLKLNTSHSSSNSQQCWWFYY